MSCNFEDENTKQRKAEMVEHVKFLHRHAMKTLAGALTHEEVEKSWALINFIQNSGSDR